ncbi:hypothetical protein B0H13DRAFT_1934806 [Mycena leptocephala]|nr:hypothetical protein B0H13DRAFT_1934806 [Mycena leptocephala]
MRKGSKMRFEWVHSANPASLRISRVRMGWTANTAPDCTQVSEAAHWDAALNQRTKREVEPHCARERRTGAHETAQHRVTVWRREDIALDPARYQRVRTRAEGAAGVCARTLTASGPSRCMRVVLPNRIDAGGATVPRTDDTEHKAAACRRVNDTGTGGIVPIPLPPARSEVAGVGLHMCARAQSSQIQMRASWCRRKGGATGAPGKTEIGAMDRPGKSTTYLRALQGNVMYGSSHLERTQTAHLDLTGSIARTRQR